MSSPLSRTLPARGPPCCDCLLPASSDPTEIAPTGQSLCHVSSEPPGRGGEEEGSCMQRPCPGQQREAGHGGLSPALHLPPEPSCLSVGNAEPGGLWFKLKVTLPCPLGPFELGVAALWGWFSPADCPGALTQALLSMLDCRVSVLGAVRPPLCPVPEHSLHPERHLCLLSVPAMPGPLSACREWTHLGPSSTPQLESGAPCSPGMS